jgi:hypothetical protein
MLADRIAVPSLLALLASVVLAGVTITIAIEADEPPELGQLGIVVPDSIDRAWPGLIRLTVRTHDEQLRDVLVVGDARWGVCDGEAVWIYARDRGSYLEASFVAPMMPTKYDPDAPPADTSCPRRWGPRTDVMYR